jgi:3-hydroxybenzoate 6-monooxygenase
MSGHHPILIAGGGLGGLSAALGLGRAGIPVRVLEGAPEFGAIGYGIQLGPNVFPMFDALGVTAAVLKKSVFPEACIWLDAFTGEEVVRVPTQQSLRARFGHPYVVIHRIDLHNALLDACRNVPAIELVPDAQVTGFDDDGEQVHVRTADGRGFDGRLLVGADGLRSVVRAQLFGDTPPKPLGYVAHRTIVPMAEVPQGVNTGIVALWGGPGFHIVHYPLRDHTLFNIVAVFETATYDRKGDLASYRAEIDRTYADAHPAMKSLLGMMDLERRWAIADRDPIRHWNKGRVTILGDAAHPALQSFAQGACMAIEDGVTLAEMLIASDGDIADTLAAFSRARYLRTARLQLESRKVWEDYHAKDVARDVTMQVYRARSEKDMFDCLAWLYDGFDIPSGADRSAPQKKLACR